MKGIICCEKLPVNIVFTRIKTNKNQTGQPVLISYSDKIIKNLD